MEEKFGISTKKFMVEELKSQLGSFPNFVITNYKGVKSQEIESLRRELGKSSSKYLVVKNSIAKRVFDEMNIKDINGLIKGEVGIGFAEDIIAASKTFIDFSKGNAAFKLNGAYIDGKLEGAERIKHLAMLPPRNVLLAMIFSYMKSPITGFVGVLNSLLRNLVYAINEIKNKKEGGEKK